MPVVSSQRATELLKDVMGGKLNDRAQRFVKTLPAEQRNDNRNFLGAADKNRTSGLQTRVALPKPAPKKVVATPAPARPARKPLSRILDEHDNFEEKLAVPPKTRNFVGQTAKLQEAFEYGRGGLKGGVGDFVTTAPAPRAAPSVSAPFATEPVARFGRGAHAKRGESGLTQEEEGLYTQIADSIQASRRDLETCDKELAAVMTVPVHTTDERRRVTNQVATLNARRTAADSTLRSGLRDLDALVKLTD
jgi:hypothetical protein